jgi:putative transposase
MKHNNIGIETLCELFGMSRQAYYQRKKYNYKEVAKSEILRQVVSQQRELMPKLGGRKLLLKVNKTLPLELQMGRDSFFRYLRENNLLIRTRRFRAITTNSNHRYRKYPNLIKGFVPLKPHQLWVSDITYVSTKEGFVYLNLITDAYSRKIIGWSIGETLESKYTVQALKMALKQLPKELNNVYHHSDRGVQYCCDQYIKLLKKHKFRISMTESGNPRDNPLAERVNGILKGEWNLCYLASIEKAIIKVKKSINIYNNHRPHMSISMLTPEMAHQQNGQLNKLWKNYWNYKYSKINIKQKSLI